MWLDRLGGLGLSLDSNDVGIKLFLDGLPSRSGLVYGVASYGVSWYWIGVVWRCWVLPLVRLWCKVLPLGLSSCLPSIPCKSFES